MKPPPRRISLAFAMIGIAVTSLCLALVAQRRSAERRERTLKARLGVELQARFSREHMARFLGELGPVILKGATRGERLAGGRDGTGKPTGRALPGEDLRKLADVLLDPAHYGYINGDDFPEPEHGVRLARGADTLDVLMDDSPSSSPGGHQDLWIVIRDGEGRVVHRSGPMCWGDARLREIFLGRAP